MTFFTKIHLTRKWMGSLIGKYMYYSTVGENDETLQLKALKCKNLQKYIHLMKCKK